MTEQVYGVGHNWQRELEDTQIRLRFAHHIIEDQTDRIAELEANLAREEWTVTWSLFLGLLFGFSFTAMTAGSYVVGGLLVTATTAMLSAIALWRRQADKNRRG